MTRNDSSASTSAPKKSSSSLASICHEVSGVERNTMQRMAEHLVETGAGDLRRKKIRDQPGLDALDLAELDDVFDAFKLRVCLALTSTPLTECSWSSSISSCGGASARLNSAGDFNVVALCLQQFPEPGCFRAAAREDDAPFILRLGYAAVHGRQQQFLFQPHERATEHDEDE